MLDSLSPTGLLPVTVPPQIIQAVEGLVISALPYLGNITKPFPAPPPPVVPSKTLFQTTPFLESNLIDPFKTTLLGVLTEEQLAVDKVGDILSTILPPEMVQELSSLKGFSNYLLTNNLSMVGCVLNLVNTLPNHTDIANLLRLVPILSVLNNVNQLTQTANDRGIIINEFSSASLINSFSFLNECTGSINTELYTNDSTAINNLNVISPITTPSVNPVMAAALIYGATTPISSSNVNLINTLTSLGVPSSASLVGLISPLSSTAFKSLALNLTTLGSVNSAKLGSVAAILAATNTDAYITEVSSYTDISPLLLVANIVSNVGLSTLNNVSFLLNNYDTPTINSADSILASYTTAQLSYLSTLYTQSSTFNFDDCLQICKTYTLTQLQSFVTEVLAEGILVYAAGSNATEFITIITMVESYGIEIVQMCLQAIEQGLISTNVIFNSENTQGVTYLINAYLKLSTTELNNLLEMAPTLLVQVLGTITTYGANTILPTADIIKTLLASTVTRNGIIQTIALGGSFPPNMTSTVYATIANLNAIEITSITDKLAITELVNLISSNNITGEILNFLIKKLSEQAALAGNLKVLISLIANYPNILTMSYLNYLIITLLQNYKLTVDDNTMGLTVAAINFTNALKVILPGWNKTVRDNKSVSNHTPFITASKDSLTLLLNSPTYAIDAILQEDIVYILPSYI